MRPHLPPSTPAQDDRLGDAKSAGVTLCLVRPSETQDAVQDGVLAHAAPVVSADNLAIPEVGVSQHGDPDAWLAADVPAGVPRVLEQLAQDDGEQGIGVEVGGEETPHVHARRKSG